MRELIIVILLFILMVGCAPTAADQPESTLPAMNITEFELGAVGTGEIIAVDDGRLAVGKLHTLMMGGQYLVVACAVERLPDGRLRLIEIELSGDFCA